MPTGDTAPHPLDALGLLDLVRELSAAPDLATADLLLDPVLAQPYGIVHGGVYAAFAERVAAAGAQAWWGERGRARVTAVGTQFLRAVRADPAPSATGSESGSGSGTGGPTRLQARATPLHRGRSQQLWQVRLTAGDDRPVAVCEVRLVNRPA